MRMSLAFSLLALPAELVYAAQINIASVTVNDMIEPLAIGSPSPQFGWTVDGSSQRGSSYTAAQVQVWSVPASASPYWDSGTVKTNATSLVYSGETLEGRRDFSVRVRLLDTDETWTSWASQSFSTGLLTDDDWASAQWIGAGGNASVDYPIIRTTFAASKPVSSARLYISGVGNYEAYINGERIGDQYMTPPWTQYDKRSFYDTYDITHQVLSGDNVIGIAVGKAWISLTAWTVPQFRGAWDGKMRAKAQLAITFEDGTEEIIVTDDSWQATIGGSHGEWLLPEQEYFDSRNESDSWSTASFDASSWPAAIVQTLPETILQATPVEPVRVVEKIQAVSISNPSAGTWVFDFGRNIAGFGVLSIDEPRGTNVTMQYGEKLSGTGTVAVGGDRVQLSAYLSNGRGPVTWNPRHTYYGYRYIQLRGVTKTPTTSTIVTHRVHSDMKSIGWFTSSNELLQWIHDVTRETLLNNIVTVPTDGSYLEKLPWLADFALMAETAFSMLDLKALITKWTQDIEDSQLKSGELPPWAPAPPEMDPFPSPTWGNSYPETVWQLYLHYGDVGVLSRFYDSMKTYLKLELGRRQSNGLIGSESWGDWVFPSPDRWAGPAAHDRLFVGTAYLYQSLKRLIDIATVLGHADDVDYYATEARAVNASFHVRFYNTSSEEYRGAPTGEFLQTSNLLPVAFGMTNPANVQFIVDKVAANVVSKGNHLTTGVLGTKWILPVLTEHGYTDLSYTVATQTTFPSWGFWRSLGATTLWEEWRVGSRSQGHAFLGSVVDWFYKHLAGIKITGPAYASVTIEPYVPTGLSNAKGQVRTPRGLLVSSWTNEPGRFTLDLTIPAGSSALVSLPVSGCKKIYEGDEPVASAEGVTRAGRKKGRALFNVVSGKYKFTVK